MYNQCQRGNSFAACITLSGFPHVVFPEISEISRVATPEVRPGLLQTSRIKCLKTMVKVF